MENKKSCVVIYTEGETEDEFYGTVINKIKKDYKLIKFGVDKMLMKCLRGITKFDKKLLKKFEYEIVSKYKKYEIIVFLCYDMDVFECTTNPPVNWSKVEKKLIELGATKVIHVKANKCIEDVFLLDLNGICNYLQIEYVNKVTGKNGVEKMQKLFKKSNRIYQKGNSCKGFVESLDIDKIFANTSSMFQPFIDILVPEDKK